MLEQNRPARESNAGGGIGRVFDDSEETDSLVTVSCGPYVEQLPVGEMSVGEIRARFRDRFDIGANSIPVVDGRDATDQTRVRAGQVLTFVQRSGEKGHAGRASAESSSLPKIKLWGKWLPLEASRCHGGAQKSSNLRIYHERHTHD